ncbi:hypothetical protein EI555_003770, partial [Monodon monoceros]
MNQPQRMAPVGTDKELSDLLDFSMLSTLLRSLDIGKEACAKNTASIWTSSSCGLKSPSASLSVPSRKGARLEAKALGAMFPLPVANGKSRPTSLAGAQFGS